MGSYRGTSLIRSHTDTEQGVSLNSEGARSSVRGVVGDLGVRQQQVWLLRQVGIHLVYGLGFRVYGLWFRV